uniref:Uncharacterized protein n=1 Tax=Arundo donax TaxID=35708 RepID=A0A0A9GQK1_ARUDO
MDWRGRRQSS